MNGRNGLWLVELKIDAAMDHIPRGERLAIKLSYCEKFQVLVDVSRNFSRIPTVNFRGHHGGVCFLWFVNRILGSW